MYMLGAGAGAGGGLSTILIFVVFIGLMYFMMIRPQKKQQDKRKQMMDSMKKGDSVVTIGGLHGVIDSIDDADKTVTLDCDGVYLVFNRSAIGRIVDQPAAQAQAPVQDDTENTDSEQQTSDEQESANNDDSQSDDPEK
ncbi:preprotein translocase subunit YajC [Ligilactobacillus salitolerans]|uniref:Preprotein translocase subunit YajC n=1 Tax=Ligilactobacillus salitolerans TaxID=1808352 RepID=A0A401IST9_9LACO|nr:preprotein translocase subunit YajC [Ligilactobacillus salitolerans]